MRWVRPRIRAIPLLVALAPVVLCRGGPTSRAERPLVAIIAFKAKGRASNGAVEAGPPEFPVGQPISVDVRIKNEGTAPWSIERRELRCPWSFVVKDSRGRAFPTTYVTAGYKWYPVAEARIEPGKELSHRVDLLRFYPYLSSPSTTLPSLDRPGQYSVQMVLRSPIKAHHVPEGKAWPERLCPDNLQSNVLHFRVVQPSARQIARCLKDIRQMSEGERVQKIQFLAAARASEAAATLAAMATDDTSPEVRVAALQALGRIGDTSFVQEVEKSVQEDPSTRVRAYAADVLRKWGLRRSVPALIASLKDREPPPPEEADVNVWYAAVIKALGDIGDPRAIPVLTEVAENDSIPWVRQAATASIERVKAGGRQQPTKHRAPARAAPAAEPSRSHTPTRSRRGPGGGFGIGAVGLVVLCALVAALVWYGRNRRKSRTR